MNQETASHPYQLIFNHGAVDPMGIEPMQSGVKPDCTEPLPGPSANHTAP